MNAITITRIEQLYPVLKTKAYQLIDTLAKQGITVEISQGLRTWPEQDALYQQGRTIPGKVVTNCKPGQSWHQFACAFDVDIVTQQGLDWTGNDAAWNATIASGLDLGLVAGAEFRSFPDKPHFQFTGRFPATPDDEVLALFQGGGIMAVWSEIDKSLSTI
jgi:peptidoglycan L-alanyl-D-glutamate endopeptidase CwlK